MALQPSRPGFLIVAALVFLALPFVWADLGRQPVDRRIVAACVVMAVVFVALALQYRRQSRAGVGSPPPA
jgi:hypothetical protein